jgi:poly-gamma-glutamate synthesis protein (capsule biosynthesis protein)
LTLFLCGDVMTGRGIDQVLPHPSDPRLYESSVASATRYVELAERANGPIVRPVDFAYVWGDALDELERAHPDARIIVLETSVTTSDQRWDKGIHYRMHPANVPCLTAARIDCCVLSNNHVLDWGYAGLVETIETLRRAGLRSSGAGRTLAEAQAPAVIEIRNEGRVLVFGFGTATSGIPSGWAATADRPGVHFLEDLSDATVERVGAMVRGTKRAGDVVVASLHWGGNWGFAVPEHHVRFAHGLIRTGIDVVHGHSSHHVRPIEIFEGKLILYGCGDFLNDYEGVPGYEQFRDDLTLMYFATIDRGTGALTALRMIPMRIMNFRVKRAGRDDAGWLRDAINRESRPFRFAVALRDDDHRELRPIPSS